MDVSVMTARNVASVYINLSMKKCCTKCQCSNLISTKEFPLISILTIHLWLESLPLPLSYYAHLGLKPFLLPSREQSKGRGDLWSIKHTVHKYSYIQCTRGDAVCCHLTCRNQLYSTQAKSDDKQFTSFLSAFPVHLFLLQGFRTVKRIKVATVSSELWHSTCTLGYEEKHDDIHTLLVRFDNLNIESWFIPSGNTTSFHDHVKHQLWPGVWGTQMYGIDGYCNTVPGSCLLLLHYS